MKIGLSTSVVDRGQTGVAKYVLALLRSLLPYSQEHRFTLFVLEKDLPLFSFVLPLMELVRVSEEFRPPVKNIMWHQRRLPLLARTHQLEVLHVPSYRRLLWQRPCALVGTIHDLAPFHVHHKYDWLRMFYGRVVVRRLARRQHSIIAVSRSTAEDLKRFFGIPGEKLTVIHNGLDHEGFYPLPPLENRSVLTDRFGLEQPFFLYVSRLEHPGKNHLRLVEAFNQFKVETKLPWQLVLAGKDSHGAAVIHKAVRESPFARDVVRLGFVAEEELPALYRAAEVFVYPSLFEGFGLPPLEAMACGCPVLCSNTGSLREVVGNAALTVAPQNAIELKRALISLGLNPGLRKRLRADGLKQAQRFNWETTARATIGVYTKVLAATGAKFYKPEQDEA